MLDSEKVFWSIVFKGEGEEASGDLIVWGTDKALVGGNGGGVVVFCF